MHDLAMFFKNKELRRHEFYNRLISIVKNMDTLKCQRASGSLNKYISRYLLQALLDKLRYVT